MRLSPSARASLGGACHALGGVWLVAGVLRLIFGVAVTFPLLPPVDLARVAPGLALAVGAAFVTVGAWLGRSARAAATSSTAAALEPRQSAALPAGPPSCASTAAEDARERIGVRTPTA